ncbi:MAG: hypothetical protein KF824_12570 [Fimbriimonadaceae bacterium]|nr:MAG: hypothetical protein KF824_12570 [Fimbriimonadaceae bacterium]
MQNYLRAAGIIISACIFGSFATAQEIKTIFASQCHVTAPGQTAAGGVEWAQTSMGLPSAWSYSGADTRTEVAYEFLSGKDAKSRLGEILPGVSNWSTLSVSGFSGIAGTNGTSAILGVQTATRFWIVLSKGADALNVINSVELERDQKAHWMPRTIPGGLQCVLPYGFAPSRRQSDAYELKFGGFEMNLNVQPPNAGSKFDIKKTVNDKVDSYKKNEAYKDVKVKRDRFREISNGEYAIIDFTEGGRKKQYVYLAGEHQGRGIQFSWVYDRSKPELKMISDRLLLTFKTSNAAVMNGASFTVPGSGLSFETPKPMEAVKNEADFQEWSCFTGGTIITTRVLDNTSRIVDNPQGAQFFVAAAQSQAKDAKDFKSEVKPYVVNGVHGQLVKCTWKNGSTPNVRYGLLVSTLEKMYVLDIMSFENGLAEQVLGSVQLVLGNTDKLGTIRTFVGSQLKVAMMDGVESITEPGDGKDYKSVEIMQYVGPGEGVLSSNLMVTMPERSIDQSKMMKNQVEEVGQAAKAKTKILNEGWGSDSKGTGYWVAYEYEINGVKMEGYSYSYVRGSEVLIQTALYITKDQNARGALQMFMNSYKLND